MVCNQNKNTVNLKKLGLMAGAVFLMPAVAMAASCPILPSERVNVKWNPGHYRMIDGKNQDAKLNDFINDYKNVPDMRGVQVAYYWSQLEPRKGVYDFSKIDSDMAKLARHGKKLAITIKYKYQISSTESSLPDFILNQPRVKVGNVTGVPGYYAQGKPGSKANNVGHLANFGHPGTRQAFNNLVSALATRYDGNETFASLSFLETAASFVASPALTELFVQGTIDMQKHTGCAFTQTPIFQNLNFPRNTLPRYIDNMKRYGVGLGGPDVFYGSFDTLSNGLNRNALAFIAPNNPYKGVYLYYDDVARLLPIGMQVHRENFDYATHELMVPEPGQRHNLSMNATVDKLYDFSVDRLKSNYIFWHIFGDGDPATVAVEARLKSPAGMPLITTCPAIYGGKCNADVGTAKPRWVRR